MSAIISYCLWKSTVRAGIWKETGVYVSFQKFQFPVVDLKNRQEKFPNADSN